VNANPPFVIQLDHITRLCDAAIDQLQEETEYAARIRSERCSTLETFVVDPLLPGCHCCRASPDRRVLSEEAHFLADARQ
jgi:hypothetical protein